MKHRKVWYLLGSCVLLLGFVAGCGMPEFESIWRDRTIVIDGKDSGAEWENARYYFDKKKVTVGLMNDADMLYIRLSTRDRSLQRQLLALGFTMWFDETGGKKKELGIHFPIGIQGSGRPMMSGNRRVGRSADSTQVDTILEAVQTELELIGPKTGERNKYSVLEVQNYNILCKIGMAEGNLVYELQYPLHRTDACPYGILSKPAQLIRIGFISPKINFSQTRNRPEGGGGTGRGQGGMGGGRGGGGMGGMGGGMGGDIAGGQGGMGGGRGGGRGGGMGGGGGMGRGGAGSRPTMEPLELWIKVKIADQPLGAVPDSAAVKTAVSPADSSGQKK